MAIGVIVAGWMFSALIVYAVVDWVMPNRRARSLWVSGLTVGLVLWVSILADALIYVWRRRGRFRAHRAHRDRCVGCGARLLHSMFHEGLSYQCASCHVIQPWATGWDRRDSIQGFMSFYDTDKYFRQATGSSREKVFAKMDERGASKSHAAAVEAVPEESTTAYAREAIAICYEVDRRCDRWFDLETRMYEPTLLEILGRLGILMAIPACLVTWRLLLPPEA